MQSNQNRGYPIRISIATVVVVSMVTLALLIIGIGWSGARQSLLDAATKSAQDAGQLVTEKARRMLEPAQVTLRLLASTSLVEAKSLDERLERVRTMTDILVSNSLVSSVFVGYGDGSFFLVRPLDQSSVRRRFNAPPKANFMVQSVQVRGGKKSGEFLFFNTERHLLERRPQADYLFDPRQRPWYKAASGSAEAIFTEPYVFFSTQQVGVTLSQSSLDGNATFGIDVVLDDLALSLSDLRITPNTQLALVNSKNQVLAYPAMNRVLAEVDGRFEFKTLSELEVPSLSALHSQHLAEGQAVPYTVDGVEWLGASLPFDVWPADGIRLLVAAPTDELLGDLKKKALHLALVVAAAALLLMPLGWFAGATIGHSLDRLSRLAKRISQFNFRSPAPRVSYVREVNALSSVMVDMGHTIETFLEISQTMAKEPKVERMLVQVLHQLVSATRCLGGAVYLKVEGKSPKSGNANGVLQQAAVDGVLVHHDDLTISYEAPSSSRAQGGEVASGVGELQMELRGRSGSLEGLLVLQYTNDEGHGDANFVEFVKKLSGMLAVSIETRQLIESQKILLDAVIKLMADAIDAKSPYTGGHCERVPHLAGMLIDRLTNEGEGPYAQFRMSEDERYEFHLGAWLHDCGKVTSPEHIIDKATKLETIYNRIHEVRMRFEVLLRDARLDYWEGLAAGGNQAQLQSVLDRRVRQLQDDFAFVARCNVGGESMDDVDVQRLESLSTTVWMRHFDNRIGLSADELRRIKNSLPEENLLPVQERLLADRPDHVVPWGARKPAVEKGDPKNRYGFDMQLPQQAQNLGEIYNLSIRRGTLTEEDRFKINDHIVQTLVMLRSLPWPAHLSRVPDIAATHHERLDGKGYPRRLGDAQLTIADRVMALADIFEALTAADRPYKAAKTLSESLRILALMARDQHVDPELFRYFLHSRLWLRFAEKFMLPAQIDAVDLAAIEKLLPSAPVAQSEPSGALA